MMQKNEIRIPNPFPIPDLSSEGRWYNGLSPVTDEKVNPRRRGWHRNLEPYRRLFSHQTLSSARKNCFFEPCDKVPKDFLDLSLTSVYEHDKDSWLPKSYCYIQPETMNKETWRVLRNKIKFNLQPPVPMGYEIKYAVTYQNESKSGLRVPRTRIHPSSLQLAAEGPHTDRTNPGYSRKIDGTYYGI